ncbi:MAG: CDP-alcohol phosphatidyltransferase family protein [Candidatus Latescibacterota bacterium]|nr:CDP-alcohol phosphatidyltransferase family protein [Candidatus Latescibacterota bacterium]
MSKPSVWIDATNSIAGMRLWGMTIVERQIREFSLIGIVYFKVFVRKRDLDHIGQIRTDFSRLYSVEIDWICVTGVQDFWEDVGGANEPLILIAGDTIYDERVLVHVFNEGPGIMISSTSRSVCHINANQCVAFSKLGIDSWELLESKVLFLVALRPEDLDQYVPSLRLKMPAFIICAAECESAQTIENHMFQRTFKGAIDVVARYGYYHLVRWLTRWLVEKSISPNTYTVLSVLCVWIASPFLASGWIGTGLVLAWFGVILDSVDGKLARLRLHLSDTMGDLEHFAATPGLALWFVSVGWHLSGGNLLDWSSETLVSGSLIILFVMDKIISGLFKYCVGRELFDYQRIDTLFHLFAARRNIALMTFSIGALVGCLAQSYELFLGWMAITFIVHFIRAGWILRKSLFCRR